jgi:hypothetical protein
MIIMNSRVLRDSIMVCLSELLYEYYSKTYNLMFYIKAQFEWFFEIRNNHEKIDIIFKSKATLPWRP